MRIASSAGKLEGRETQRAEVTGDGLHELLQRAFVRLGPCNQMVARFLYESCQEPSGTSKMNG
jgi:hypothetical protein